MSFWDFDDNRYKGARALMILSILGVLVTAFGLTLMFWSYEETPSKTGEVTSSSETNSTPSPEDLRLAKLRELRIEMEGAVEVRDGAKMEALARGILEIEPKDAAAWSHVGHAQQNRGENAEALESYGKAIELQPTEPFYLYLRARLHRKLGDFPSAISDLQEASRKDPASAGMANLLLIYKIDAGEVEDVRRIIQTYEQAQIHEQAGLWLLAAAALSMQDGNPDRAANCIAAFQRMVGPAVVAELLSDSFFDPYRNQAELLPYFSNMIR